jgi:IS6 family transposase
VVLDVDRSTVFRWVQKFGPEAVKRTERHLSRASLNWHVDETGGLAEGEDCYLWRAIDTDGRLVDFRLTARRDAKATKSLLNKERWASSTAPSCLDLHGQKAPTYRKVIREINPYYDHFDHITHIDRRVSGFFLTCRERKPCGSERL